MMAIYATVRRIYPRFIVYHKKSRGLNCPLDLIV
jgi:hypothetical protein